MPTATLESRLQNVTGTLKRAFSRIDPSTMQHADEIISARTEDGSLGLTEFWTADGCLYTVEDDGRVFLHLTRGPQNPVLNNIERATTQLIIKGRYEIEDEEEVARIVAHRDTLTVSLLDLVLRGDNDDGQVYFDISTSKYDSLNPAQRVVAERIYGQGERFHRNMAMLATKMDYTRVYVLRPCDVRTHTKGKVRGIAQAAVLDSFDMRSAFDAISTNVESPCYLRGVPSDKAAKGSEPTQDYRAAIRLLTENPKKTIKYLTDATARGLLALVNAFYNPQR